MAARRDLEVPGARLTASPLNLPRALAARSVGSWSAFWLPNLSAVHLNFFLFLVGNDLTS